MNYLKPKKDDLEGGRLLVRHFLIVATALSLSVALWAYFMKPVAGIGAFCTFLGMLLPAWQLSSKSGIYSGMYRDLASDTKINLWFTLMGIVLTAIGYAVALPTMF